MTILSQLVQQTQSVGYIMRSDTAPGQCRGGFDPRNGEFSEAAQAHQIAIKLFRSDLLAGKHPVDEPRRDQSVSVVFDQGRPIEDRSQFTYIFPVRDGETQDHQLKNLLMEAIIESGRPFSSNMEVKDYFSAVYIPVPSP